jgi:hypothetical protein
MDPNLITSTENLSDSPIKRDLLGFDRFVEVISSRISRNSDNSPLTIGIYGEWGSGKTSFLRLVDISLRSRNIHSIWFNAWKYSDEKDLRAALLQTVLTQMQVQGSIWKRAWRHVLLGATIVDIRKGLGGLLVALLNWFVRLFVIVLSLLIVFVWTPQEIESVLGAAFNTPIVQLTPLKYLVNTNIIKALLALVAIYAAKPETIFNLFNQKANFNLSSFIQTNSYRNKITSLAEFSDEFSRLVRIAGKPVVVMIDDLDRCLPEKAVEILETIKLFLDSEGCVFILALDRDIMERAIAVKYKELPILHQPIASNPLMSTAAMAENYVEKILNLSFTLPPISDSGFRNFLKRITSDRDVLGCIDVFATGLPRNPRKAKRIIRVFLFLRDLVSVDINEGRMRPSLIAKMVIIQNQYRNIYSDIVAENELLEYLEYRSRNHNINSDTANDRLHNKELDSRSQRLLAEKPELRKLLLQQIDSQDHFAGILIEQYIFLVKPVIDSPESTFDDKIAETRTNWRLSFQNWLVGLPSISRASENPPANKLTSVDIINAVAATRRGEMKPSELAPIVVKTLNAGVLPMNTAKNILGEFGYVIQKSSDENGGYVATKTTT